MTRLLVLQQLFNLSDEQMEFQLIDRMSFQRFAGLKHSGRVPDRNTIWVFRERLVQATSSIRSLPRCSASCSSMDSGPARGRSSTQHRSRTHSAQHGR